MRTLQIETTNLCNSKCIFCPHDKIKKFGTMTDELFKKILTDAKEMPNLEIIIPMLTGEPFMDKKIIKRLKLINKIHSNLKIPLFTNGSLLNKKLIKQLVKIKNLEIYFSLNATYPKMRKKIMGLNDFNHVVEMINYYSSFKKQFRVTIINHPLINPLELHHFKQRWADNALICYFKNFAGESFQATPLRNCNRAITDMTVLWNGKVNLCCMDSLGKTIFGDLNKQTVKEVWESEARQKYVEGHEKGKGVRNSLCENCTGA